MTRHHYNYYHYKYFEHYKYLAWGIIYLADMEILSQKYPKVYNQFLADKHTVSRAKDDSAFNTVANRHGT